MKSEWVQWGRVKWIYIKYYNLVNKRIPHRKMREASSLIEQIALGAFTKFTYPKWKSKLHSDRISYKRTFLLPSHASSNLYSILEQEDIDKTERAKEVKKLFFQCFTSIHTQKKSFLFFLQLARKSIISQLTWNICKEMDGASQGL